MGKILQFLRWAGIIMSPVAIVANLVLNGIGIWQFAQGTVWIWTAIGSTVFFACTISLVYSQHKRLARLENDQSKRAIVEPTLAPASLYLASPKVIGEAVLEWVLRGGYWVKRETQDGMLFKFAIRDDQGRPVTIGMSEKESTWIQLATGIGLDPAAIEIFRGLSQAKLAKFKGDVTIEMSRYPMLNLQGEPFQLVVGDRVAVNASLNEQLFLLAIANIKAAFDVGMEVVRRNIDVQVTDSHGSTSRTGGSQS